MDCKSCFGLLYHHKSSILETSVFLYFENTAGINRNIQTDVSLMLHQFYNLLIKSRIMEYHHHSAHLKVLSYVTVSH